MAGITEWLQARREIGATRARCSLEPGLPSPASAGVAVRFQVRDGSGATGARCTAGPGAPSGTGRAVAEAGRLEPSVPLRPVCLPGFSVVNLGRLDSRLRGNGVAWGAWIPACAGMTVAWDTVAPGGPAPGGSLMPAWAASSLRSRDYRRNTGGAVQ